MVRGEGIYHEFPWFHDTILNKGYVDMHFLATLLLIPFTFFDLIVGAKIATAFFATVLVLVFYWFLKRHSVRHAYFWTFLLVASSFYFLRRIIYPRIFIPLSLVFMILAVHFILKKKHKSLLALSFFYSWMYTAAPLILLPGFIYSGLCLLARKKIDIKGILYSSSGLVLGMVINPYFPRNFYIDYIQIIKLAFFRPEKLMNTEWMPFTIREFFTTNFLVLAVFLFSLAFYLFYLWKKNPGFGDLVKRKQWTKIKHKRSFDMDKALLFFMALFFLLYMIKSKRMIEYFVPFTILFCAFVVTDQKIRHSIKYKNVLLVLLIAGAGLNLYLAYISFGYYDTVNNFEDCASWLNDNSEQGDLVFLQWWDQMPVLYFYDHKNYYTLGFDEGFLYYHNKSMFDDYKKVQRAEGDIYGIIADEFDSDYVFLYKAKDSLPLYIKMQEDKRFSLGFEGKDCVVFEVD